MPQKANLARCKYSLPVLASIACEEISYKTASLRTVQAYVAVPASPPDTDQHTVFSASSFISQLLHITGMLPSLVATLVFELYSLLHLGPFRPSLPQSSS